ncbi:hypothetical protein ZIOFF_069963 [Zingiber officinale]|uniref:Protein FAM33A n=1 Tax=Zingiber officinale TaxID=94328 RepID=A0A8J5CBZ7_ZINOF|nr:hypothetical protein ZIOFF_069963 [Zingiber officinale]
MTIFGRDADTGEAKFGYQKTPHDEWDYAGVNVMMLSDQKDKDGKMRKLLTHPDRNGIVYTLDRTDGTLVEEKESLESLHEALAATLQIRIFSRYVPEPGRGSIACFIMFPSSLFVSTGLAGNSILCVKSCFSFSLASYPGVGKCNGLDSKIWQRPEQHEEGIVMADLWRHHHHHPAVDDVMKVLSKASQELILVQCQLDQEFQQSYPDDVNPCKIVARIKKIQEDLVSLKELCRELLAEKQDLIDKARTVLAGQRHSLQLLLSSSGLPSLKESDDIAYSNLNQELLLYSAHEQAHVLLMSFYPLIAQDQHRKAVQ